MYENQNGPLSWAGGIYAKNVLAVALNVHRRVFEYIAYLIMWKKSSWNNNNSTPALLVILIFFITFASVYMHFSIMFCIYFGLIVSCIVHHHGRWFKLRNFTFFTCFFFKDVSDALSQNNYWQNSFKNVATLAIKICPILGNICCQYRSSLLKSGYFANRIIHYDFSRCHLLPLLYRMDCLNSG